MGDTKLNKVNMKADGQWAGSPFVQFDAVAIVLSDDGCATLINDSAAIGFTMDAYAHVKTIGYSEGAKPLLDKAGIVEDDGVVGIEKFVDIAPARHWDREPKVRMLA
jgi:catalase